MDGLKIERRVKARKLAADVMELVRDESRELDDESQKGFWQEMARLVMAELPPAPVSKASNDLPMTQAECRMFEGETMPFGKFAGGSVRGVPLRYLDRLVDPSPFMKQLKRYLASEWVKRERDAADQLEG